MVINIIHLRLEEDGIKEYIEGKTIVVTGGGGSIGSELCRQLRRFNPSKIVIVDIYENNAYDLQMEFERLYRNDKIKHKPEIIVLIAIFFQFIKKISRSKTIFFLSEIVSLTYAMPGAVIALSLILLLSFLSKIFGISIIFGSVAILVYAYVMRYMAVGISPLRSSFEKHPDSFDETGKNLGMSNFNLFKKTNTENLILSKKVKDSMSLGKANFNLGYYFRYSEFIIDSAYYYYHKAEKVYRGLNDRFDIVSALLEIAAIQRDEKDFTGSEVTSIDAISILEGLEQTNIIRKYTSFFYNNIGLLLKFKLYTCNKISSNIINSITF